MTNKIKHAKGLYLEGIRDGNIWEALNAYTGERYTQHSTGVGDGNEGFAAFFEPFLKRNPVRDIQIVRTIEDGQYVFVHAYQSLNNGESQWVTADIFDTDDQDRMIEHWDVIQEYTAENGSGRSMVDGATEVEDIEKTEENRAFMERFCNVILLGGEFDRMKEFMAEDYAQHSPEGSDGLAGFAKLKATLDAEGKTIKFWKVHRLVVQGNFAATLGHLQLGQSHYCTIDIYRIKDGQIVEHWDVTEKILAPEEWNNQGKF